MMRGVVFDLDGTLTDNMEHHLDAFARFSERHGIALYAAGGRSRYDGRSNRDIFPDLMGRPLNEDELHRFTDEKESLYREFSKGRLVPLPGLLDLLERLRQRGVRSAIATSAPGANVAHTLGELQIAHWFDAVVRSEEVARGKPHPDVFLEAARRLGVVPEECLAFEDAPMGVIAAKRAGMTCVAVTTSFTIEEFRQHDALADGGVANYEDFIEGGYEAYFAAPVRSRP